MTIRVRTLASGSSGNASFVRMGQARLLIDAGISYPRICAGLLSMGESVEELTALLITHEHTDHISGVEALLEHHPNLPIYATAGTFEGCRSSAAAQIVVAGQAFRLGDVEVVPFRVSHDAREPVGFRFEVPGFALGFVTDLGVATREVLACLKGCQVLVVEANYDTQTLQWSRYPAFLKKRIAGRGGHLSNDQAGELLKRVAGPTLEQVILGHLSEENNTPERAIAVVRAALGGQKSVRVIAADRNEPGPVLSFQPRALAAPLPQQGILPF
ncbi:MAG: MBL fold metallo-hydrolase [Bradymonadaceae bacterium]|nr:MBL fold metallo-hydrolase [Lujinxingiaceae bacterium]